MDTLTVLNRITFYAAQLSSKHMRDLQNGSIERVIEELQLNMSENDSRVLDNATGKDIVAEMIVKVWNERGINNILADDVKKWL